jgi:hypothetical protein
MKPLPCPHLAPAFQAILDAGGNPTVILPTNYPSEYRFVHMLDKGPTFQSAQALAAKTGVEFWVNNDPHYDLDCGLSCKQCGLVIAWLQERATIAI